jgi:hypothetical protein
MVEAYRGKRNGAADALAMRILGGKLLSVDGHRYLLEAAKFSDVEVFEDHNKGWLCAVGVKD